MNANMEYTDLLIIGAGISGIGAASFAKQRTKKSIMILEMREELGGTWSLFKYPGLRSDSDMYTLSFSFKPWNKEKSIVSGPDILQYLNDVVDENGLRPHIRYGQKVVTADFCSASNRWTVTTAAGKRFTSQFIYFGSGYYDYDEGYFPAFKGIEDYQGEIVHPQKWNPQMSTADKKITVIGSGATAITLIPSLASTASHVTMLQRSPTYIGATPGSLPLNFVERFLIRCGAERLVFLVRRIRYIFYTMWIYLLAKAAPKLVKAFIIHDAVRRTSPEMKKHFTPHYNPWDQRLCACPDGDFFNAVNGGKVTVVTDHIEHFDEKGIALKSGGRVDSDIVVVATGLKLALLGKAQITLDGEVVDTTKLMMYRGFMPQSLPNFFVGFGYTNASWTLKVELSCDLMCRVINHMEKLEYASCTPTIMDPDIQIEEFNSLSSGYVQRSKELMPKMGTKAPWKLYQNYFADYASFKWSGPTDPSLIYEKGRAIVEEVTQTAQQSSSEGVSPAFVSDDAAKL